MARESMAAALKKRWAKPSETQNGHSEPVSNGHPEPVLCFCPNCGFDLRAVNIALTIKR